MTTTYQDFFAGLIAALRLHDVEFIETRANVHHRQFDRVVKELETLSRTNAPGTGSLPAVFRPTIATGLYGEWDDALLALQQGFGSSPNPSYLGLKLVLTKREAADVLADFDPEARQILDHLAAVYSGEVASSVDAA